MAKSLVGLDVGTFSVKAVYLENRGRAQDFEVVNFHEVPLGLEPEAVMDLGQLRNKQEEAIFRLRQEHFFDERPVIAGLPGDLTQTRILKLPFKDQKKVAAVLGGVLDAQFPFSVDDLVLSWFLADSSHREAQDEKSADAEYGVLVGYAKKQDVAGFLAFLGKSGVDPRILTTGTFALFELSHRLLAPEQESANLLVDLGHTTTNICCAGPQQMAYGRTLLSGGMEATKAIATRLSLPFFEAQKMKHQGAEAGDAISEILKETYSPVIRELRQTILAVRAQEKISVKKIILLGGGSQIKHIDQWIADALGIATVKLDDLVRGMPQTNQINSSGAVALGYGLTGFEPPKKATYLNFRRDEFAFKGAYDFLPGTAKPFVVWACVIFLFLLLNGVVSVFTMNSELAALQTQQIMLCEKTVGGKAGSSAQCLQQMKDKIAKGHEGGIGSFSAVDIYLQIAKAVPPEVRIKVTELQITDKTVQLGGDTSSFDGVDQIVSALSKVPCFARVEKSRARQSAQGIGFEINIERSCVSPQRKA